MLQIFLGTRTGNAINYTASTLLKVGNRPEARDVVLLITDGASQDDVVVPSANLHATGALVKRHTNKQPNYVFLNF